MSKRIATGTVAFACLLTASLSFLSLQAMHALGAEGTKKHRVYVRLMDPREHPDYQRRHVQPPNWETFGNRTRFTSLRSFSSVKQIDKYTRQHELGDVLWPSYSLLLAKNVSELVEEIKRRDLFLYDIMGYVPGSGPGGFWRQFTPPADVLQMIQVKLGDHWLGMDNGEQDGRYIACFAAPMIPASADRFQQYLNFQRHFQYMCDELGNKMATLVSLNFGHYFLKEGVYTLIGAETAQGLPNGQVYYAFIRGAGKQYGVPWFGNASVFNRWGYKSYGPEKEYRPGRKCGPKQGTSLSLLKRLMYSHILYNSMITGFEMSMFEPGGEKLSPVGKIQQAARRWVKENPRPGVMVTPVAVMLDFFSGWSFPRHLYTGNTYRVWGNLPYQPGDYLTDGVLDILYPGYQDSSYFHNEQGFITPTPFGDAADCVISDAPDWLLGRYALLVVAGELRGGAEIRDKLTAYAQAGGQLVITAGSLANLPGGLAGACVTGPAVEFGPKTSLKLGDSTIEEQHGFAIHRLQLPAEAQVIAKCKDMPAVVKLPCGKGSVTVLASPFGVGQEPATKAVGSAVDKPLGKPYPLLKHVQAVLTQAFHDEMLFEVGQGLSLITCRKGQGEYTLGVCNNSLQQRPMKIVSHCGPIQSVRELQLDQSEKGAEGYLPGGFETAKIGTSKEGQIAGGDVRIFSVAVREENVETVPHVVPDQRPQGRLLPLREASLIKKEILARPTFFEHFDGVVVDWRYLHRREKAALEKEAGWIGRQKLQVMVDLSSGVNLYPDLRLIDNIKKEHARSLAAIEDVLAKMPILGAQHLILTLHRRPENNFTEQQTQKSLLSTVRTLCAKAKQHKVTMYLRVSSARPPTSVESAIRFIEQVGAENLLLAPSTALLLASNVDPKKLAKSAKGKVGLWLVSQSRRDMSDRLWDVHAPIAQNPQEKKLAEYLSISPEAPLVLDAVYRNQDEEYHDSRALGRIEREIKKPR